MSASEAEPRGYQRALDNAERQLGQPLSLPLGPGEPRVGHDFRRLVTVRTFGDSWSQAGLDDRGRALVSVVIAAALGTHEPLRGQLRIALNSGVTEEEIVEIFINNFDPAVSQNLRPYAHACISGEIKRFFRDKRWLLRVSRTDQELLLSAKQTQASLTAELGGEPTDGQVADRLNVSTDDLRRAYQAHNAFAPGSLDAPVSGDDDREIGEFLGIDDPAIERSTDMDAIRRHWHELPPPQRRILLMRFYGNMTQSQVASRLHYSQMHVSRLQTRALAFLRGRLLAE